MAEVVAVEQKQAERLQHRKSPKLKDEIEARVRAEAGEGVGAGAGAVPNKPALH